jgi:hypothetical protein
VGRAVAVGIAGAAAGVLLVGCSSASSGQAGASGASATGKGTAVAGASASPAGGASPRAASPGAVGTSGSTQPTVRPGSSGGLAILECPTAGLTVTDGGSQGAAAGSAYYTIDFRNSSGRTCFLDGYPGVALTSSTSTGSQVGAAAQRVTMKPVAVITLAPGQVASATVQVAAAANYPSANCDPETGNYLQVYPPGQTAAAYVPFHAQGCRKPVFVLGVTTVVAGA